MNTLINNPTSVLNTEVSLFINYQSVIPRPIKLLDFLTKKTRMKELFLIRQEQDKKIRDMLKSRVPAITPSGVFSTRNNAGLMYVSNRKTITAFIIAPH